MAYPNFAVDGDLTNSRPALQLRVAQGAILDEEENRLREGHAKNPEYVHPYSTNAPSNVRGCIPGEIALKRKRTGKAVTEDDIYGGHSDEPKLNATLLPHFTHLNGLPVEFDQKTYDALGTEEKRCLIENEFQVAGIVGTVAEPDYEGKELGRNVFVVEIGGVGSIINNNPKLTILQGQLVLGRAPDPANLPLAPAGTHKDKVLVVTEPFDPRNVISKDTVVRHLQKSDEDFKDHVLKNPHTNTSIYSPNHFTQALHGFFKIVYEEGQKNPANFDATPATIMKNVLMAANDTHLNTETVMLLNAFHEVNHHVQSQVIGIALSDAPPNTRFDLRFGSYAT